MFKNHLSQKAIGLNPEQNEEYIEKIALYFLRCYSLVINYSPTGKS